MEWAHTSVLPLLGLLPRDVDYQWFNGIRTLKIHKDDDPHRTMESLWKVSESGIRQVKALPEVEEVDIHPSGEIVILTLTPLFVTEARYAGAKQLVKLELIGLICNAKTLHLLGVYVLDKRNCLVGKAVSEGEIDIGAMGRLVGEGLADLSQDVIGIGYLDEDQTVANCPRAHTPAGVAIKGQGYGTSLYVGLACLAEMLGDSCIGSAPESETYGPRSDDADEWWFNAVIDRPGRPALAEEVPLSDLEWDKDKGQDEELGGSGTYEPTRPERRDLTSSIVEEFEQVAGPNAEGFEVTELNITYDYIYNKKATFDLDDVAGIAATMPLSNAVEQGLVLWLASPDSDTSDLIAQAYEEYVDRFKRLNPGTDDMKILKLLREILIAGKISNDELARWEATHGMGGRGTGFLFEEDVMFGEERDEPDLDQGGVRQLRTWGQPEPRVFAQLPLPGSLAPNRARPPSDPELRALVEPWMDDNS